MCHEYVQCSIASIHVSYTRTVQYCHYPWVIHTYSAVLPVSMSHTHIQCSISSIHVSHPPTHTHTRTVQYCQYPCVTHTYSAVLPVSMCHTHACVNKISVFWLYEISASISDNTGLPKHASLYITYSTIGCTACLYETFPYLNNYSHRNGSQKSEHFFRLTKKLKLIVFYLFNFVIYYCYKQKLYDLCFLPNVIRSMK